MNKKFAALVVGGLVTVSLAGLGFNETVGRAAEKVHQAPMMQVNQAGNMDPKNMAEMMKNPDMQKAMKDVMRAPEMQGIMKQMLQQDMGFHQMMSDLVNSVDMSSDHNMPHPTTPQDTSAKSGHGAHHG